MGDTMMHNDTPEVISHPALDVTDEDVQHVGSDVLLRRFEDDRGRLTHLILAHNRPDTGEPCSRLVFRDGYFPADEWEDAPRWTFSKTGQTTLTVRELIHCSTCGWGGYLRSGEWVPQEEKGGAHLYAAGTVLHRTWEGDIPEGCQDEETARAQARGDARLAAEASENRRVGSERLDDLIQEELDKAREGQSERQTHSRNTYPEGVEPVGKILTFMHHHDDRALKLYWGGGSLPATTSFDGADVTIGDYTVTDEDWDRGWVDIDKVV